MSRLLHTIAALAATALVLFGAKATSAQSSYRIQPGDVVTVEVLEDSSLNRSLLVSPDGYISFPMAGVIRAGNRTIEQLRAAITNSLRPDFTNEPTVFVAMYSIATEDERELDLATVSVFVLGEVAEPGEINVEPGTSILQVFAMMGGFTDYAATKRIQLRRRQGGAEQSIKLNYKAIEKGESLDGMIPVQDGDVIIVPQRRLFE